MNKLSILTTVKAATGTAVQTLEQINAPVQPEAPANTKRLSSIDLFSGARELVIDHAGDQYRLRRTSQGKLILTK